MLKIIQDEILIKHAWIKQNYEESWPIPALIKTAIENCKTVLRQKAKQKGENVKWIPGLQRIAHHVSQNNTAIDNVAIKSDTELGNCGNDPTKSDEESDDSCTKFDGGHTESDDDQIESDDYHAKGVGNQGITGKVKPNRDDKDRVIHDQSDETSHPRQPSAKKCKIPSRIRLHLPSKNKYIDDALMDEDIDPLCHIHPQPLPSLPLVPLDYLCSFFTNLGAPVFHNHLHFPRWSPPLFSIYYLCLPKYRALKASRQL
ncbi:uncharacterized protein EI90DRAFT_3128848 [Cantharellus anzutake]|uniref:uncharacterized protein n=1 Tax=Cantharellus anzutake TaxID=1750568 RepID=UPI001904AB26|nr:uncharacterized protein EI90DRAFT_3128848 [Cantharellus anzutake]KAF8325303.1 hypothetical protein EI90DRAFT_3128848 [Cantharellus anzutake]